MSLAARLRIARGWALALADRRNLRDRAACDRRQRAGQHLAPAQAPAGPERGNPADGARRPLQFVQRLQADDFDHAINDLTAAADHFDAVGLPERTALRIFHYTHLDWITADKFACALGHHPGELWPQWFTTPETENTA